ncbi:MAG: hypothetical protein PHG96_06565, partial [Kiritimatiellae bacterium]|nr:hypothetical protein [Kiritimatiellia bacterium]
HEGQEGFSGGGGIALRRFAGKPPYHASRQGHASGRDASPRRPRRRCSADGSGSRPYQWRGWRRARR